MPDPRPPHCKIDTYWGCGQPSNQVLVNKMTVSEQPLVKVVVVQVWSTAAPPGLSPTDLEYLSPGMIVVDDHKGVDEPPSVQTVPPRQ